MATQNMTSPHRNVPCRLIAASLLSLKRLAQRAPTVAKGSLAAGGEQTAGRSGNTPCNRKPRCAGPPDDAKPRVKAGDPHGLAGTFSGSLAPGAVGSGSWGLENPP